MKTSPRCWAEVDLEALRGNLAWIRHRVGPRVKILTVVKADAYGHGLKQIAALLMQSGTDIFGVANLAEAQAIRSVGEGWPILMLGACLPDEVETAVRDAVRPTISSLVEAQAFSAAANRLRQLLPVHVKVDTGMGRLGIEAARATELLHRIGKLPGLALAGLYTHYASAEDDPKFSRAQARRFQRLLDELADAGIRVPLIHANNSAALLHQPQTQFNLVRPGLLVYGVLPPGQRRDKSVFQKHLRPALSFKCRVSLVKTIAKGASLSYGRTFVAPRPMRVAILTAGFGDGYLRAGSNRARVLVGGQRCRVLGRITMDQMLVDVSRVDGIAPGDEAVLIGRQAGEVITANELAAWCRTIPWEVLTAITYRVPRLYRGSQAA
ncbi:MAG: alanine racemase [Verrucomicrobia bacterium]|nr:MAG: alanine racemase [Verrucomicrobiota bacterium]